MARPAIRLATRRVRDRVPPVGSSKFIGRPDLPADLPWSMTVLDEPLMFLAQLNLAECSLEAKLEPLGGLQPVHRERTLYFIISEADLAEQMFERAYLVEQCC